MVPPGTEAGADDWRAGLAGRGVGGDLPEPGQRLRVGGDDVPEVIGRLVGRPYLHCLCQGSDGDAHEGPAAAERPGACIRPAPGRSPATSTASAGPGPL